MITTQIPDGWAIPPYNTYPGFTVITHVAIKVPHSFQHLLQGLQVGRTLWTGALRINTENSQRPTADFKSKGGDPLVHWSKLQPTGPELGGYK